MDVSEQPRACAALHRSRSWGSLRDVAADLAITERRACGIVADLADAGYVVKKRDGRRNRYEIRAHLPLPERVESPPSIGDVLDLLVSTDRQQRREPDAARATHAV